MSSTTPTTSDYDAFAINLALGLTNVVRLPGERPFEDEDEYALRSTRPWDWRPSGKSTAEADDSVTVTFHEFDAILEAWSPEDRALARQRLLSAFDDGFYLMARHTRANGAFEETDPDQVAVSKYVYVITVNKTAATRGWLASATHTYFFASSAHWKADLLGKARIVNDFVNGGDINVEVLATLPDFHTSPSLAAKGSSDPVCRKKKVTNAIRVSYEGSSLSSGVLSPASNPSIYVYVSDQPAAGTVSLVSPFDVSKTRVVWHNSVDERTGFYGRFPASETSARKIILEPQTRYVSCRNQRRLMSLATNVTGWFAQRDTMANMKGTSGYRASGFSLDEAVVTAIVNAALANPSSVNLPAGPSPAEAATAAGGPTYFVPAGLENATSAAAAYGFPIEHAPVPDSTRKRKVAFAADVETAPAPRADLVTDTAAGAPRSLAELEEEARVAAEQNFQQRFNLASRFVVQLQYYGLTNSHRALASAVTPKLKVGEDDALIIGVDERGIAHVRCIQNVSAVHLKDILTSQYWMDSAGFLWTNPAFSSHTFVDASLTHQLYDNQLNQKRGDLTKTLGSDKRRNWCAGIVGKLFHVSREDLDSRFLDNAVVDVSDRLWRALCQAYLEDPSGDAVRFSLGDFASIIEDVGILAKRV